MIAVFFSGRFGRLRSDESKNVRIRRLRITAGFVFVFSSERREKMWRRWCSSSASLLSRRLLANGVLRGGVSNGTLGLVVGVSSIQSTTVRSSAWFCTRVVSFSSSVDSENSSAGSVRSDEDKSESNGGLGLGIGRVNEESCNGIDGETISFAEAKRLMRLVNVEALKMKLGTDGKEAIGYLELLEACKSMGVARSEDEAATFARVLDEAGVVLLFRDKVYLHPDKVGTMGVGWGWDLTQLINVLHRDVAVESLQQPFSFFIQFLAYLV